MILQDTQITFRGLLVEFFKDDGSDPLSLDRLTKSRQQKWRKIKINTDSVKKCTFLGMSQKDT